MMSVQKSSVWICVFESLSVVQVGGASSAFDMRPSSTASVPCAFMQFSCMLRCCIVVHDFSMFARLSVPRVRMPLCDTLR